MNRITKSMLSERCDHINAQLPTARRVFVRYAYGNSMVCIETEGGGRNGVSMPGTKRETMTFLDGMFSALTLLGK